MSSQLHRPLTPQTGESAPQGDRSWGALAGQGLDYLGLGSGQITLGNAAVAAQIGANSLETLVPTVTEAPPSGDGSTQGTVQGGPSGWTGALREGLAPLIEVMDYPCGPIERMMQGLGSTLSEYLSALTDPFTIPAMTCEDADADNTYAQVDGDIFVNQLGETFESNPLEALLIRMLQGLGVSPNQDPKDISNFISPSDVNQGKLGDCYFNAAMMALADGNPQAIADAITDLGGGTYAVTFWVPSADGQGRTPITVEVTNIFPVDEDGVPLYSQPSSDQPGPVTDIWPLILEAGYAKLSGGYQEIEGGNAGDAMALISGEESTLLQFGEDDGLQQNSGLTDEQWAAFEQQVETGSVVAGVRDDLSVGPSVDGQTTLSSGDVLFGNHAYVVMSLDLNEGVVVLENPWATDETKYGGDDSQVTLTLEEFEMYFYRIQSNPSSIESEAAPGNEPVS